MEVQYAESGEIEAGPEAAPYLLKNFVRGSDPIKFF